MKLNRIKAVLSEKGISQTWLAKKLDKSSYDRKAGLQGSVPDHDAGVGAGDPQFGNIAANS